MGFRFRLSVDTLPGKPDIVLPRLKRIIEVRGCFWHQHAGCVDSHIPKSHREYWQPKLTNNQRRDEQNGRKLRELGWRVCVVWECEATRLGKLSKRIAQFLRK